MDFLASLVQSINLLLSFVMDVLRGLIDFLAHIPLYFDWAMNFVQIIPPEIRTFAVAGIALSAVLIFIPAVKE